MKKYIVNEGDTMWKISKATGVRLNLLIAANPQIRDPNQLQPGSLILIPEVKKGGANAGAGYTGGGVPSTPAQGKASPPSASPGTGSEVPPYFGFVWPHTVQPGESWTDIAKQYGVTPMQLQQLNPAQTPDTVTAGDTVYVPALGLSPDGTLLPGAVGGAGSAGSSNGVGQMPAQEPGPWPPAWSPAPGMPSVLGQGYMEGPGLGYAPGYGYPGQTGYAPGYGYPPQSGYAPPGWPISYRDGTETGDEEGAYPPEFQWREDWQDPSLTTPWPAQDDEVTLKHYRISPKRKGPLGTTGFDVDDH